MENFKIIEPREGATNHISSHKNINIALLSFTAEISELKKDLKQLARSYKKTERYVDLALSTISKRLDTLELDIDTKVDTILSRLTKPEKKEYFIKDYSGIIDTTSETEIELEKIEFSKQGLYKVDIVGISVTPNDAVSGYFLPEANITEGGFYPMVGVKSDNGAKGVLRYKFKVLIHQL